MTTTAVEKKNSNRRLPKPLSDTGLERIIARSRNLDNHLGDIVFWACSDVEIAPEVLKGFLTKRGIEEAWAPVPVRAKTAARKAIVRCREILEAGHLGSVLVRPVDTAKKGEARYAIVDEKTDAVNADLDYTIRNQVVFDSTNGTLDFTGDEIPEIRQMFDHLCGVHTTAEIMLMTRNILTRHGCIKINDGSGMYFVPDKLREIVDGLMGLFNHDLQDYGIPGKPGKCFFTPIGILDDKEARGTIGDIFKADISVDLEEAREQLAKAREMEKHQPKALKAALDRYNLAHGKASMYADLLDMNLADLKLKIESAQEEANKLLFGNEDDDGDDDEGDDDE